MKIEEIINHTNTSSIIDQDLVALLNSDEAFLYNSTYISHKENDLTKFKERVITLKEVLESCNMSLNKEITNQVSDKIKWYFKIQIDQAVELECNSKNIKVVERKENILLSFLSSANKSPFLLTLFFSYRLNHVKTPLGVYSRKYTIEHSFKVETNREDKYLIRKAVKKFICIVKNHIDASKKSI